VYISRQTTVGSRRSTCNLTKSKAVCQAK